MVGTSITHTSTATAAAAAFICRRNQHTHTHIGAIVLLTVRSPASSRLGLASSFRRHPVRTCGAQQIEWWLFINWRRFLGSKMHQTSQLG